MIFKKFLFYFQKICIFFNYKKLKEKMSRKISKFYVISFIIARIIFFKKKFNTTSNENAYSDIVY